MKQAIRMLGECARGAKTAESTAEVAELADARDSKSREVTPHVGSIPTFGSATNSAQRPGSTPRMRRFGSVSSARAT